MQLRIDSKAVILAMVEDPSTFPTIIAALDKDIAKYLTVHFKDKGMQLDRLQATHHALGEVGIALIFESLDEKTIAALLKKVDPHAGTSPPNAALENLKGLASGKIEPKPKPEKVEKTTSQRTKVPLKRAGADKAASAKGTGTRPTGSIGTGDPPPAEVTAPVRRPKVTKKATSKVG